MGNLSKPEPNTDKPSAKYAINTKDMEQALKLARKRSMRIKRSAVVDRNVLNQPFTI